MSTPTALRPMARNLLRSNASQHIPPTFLLPSLTTPSSKQAPFSTTSSNSSRTRDNNPDRGVSTARRTGLRQPVSISKLPIPKPVRADKIKTTVEVDPNHGLYGFFHSKDKPLATPEENAAYGRPWGVEELRAKSWEDLHALWWVCAKERNRLATEKHEIKRLGGMYGDNEINHRASCVRRTQRGIKHALTERYYSWREAEILAKKDAEIDLSGEGQVYTPMDYMEEDVEVDEDIPEEITEQEAKELEALEAQEVEDAKKAKEAISPEAIPESKAAEKQTII